MEHFMSHFMSYFMYPHQACHTGDHGGSSWEAPAVWGVMAVMLLRGGGKEAPGNRVSVPPVLSVINYKSNGLWIASLLHQYNLRDKNFQLSMFVCPTIARKPDFGGFLGSFLWIMNAVYSHTLLIMQIVQTNLPSISLFKCALVNKRPGGTARTSIRLFTSLVEMKLQSYHLHLVALHSNLVIAFAKLSIFWGVSLNTIYLYFQPIQRCLTACNGCI